jgi:hypothetical protein
LAVHTVTSGWPIEAVVTSPVTNLPRLRARLAMPMGSLGVLIKFSVDLFMASIASTAGLIWARESGLPMPPVWMVACYAPMLLVIFAMRST